MDREEILKILLDSDSNRILLELATSVGKSRMAIEKLKQWSPKTILIVVPRLVLINNWKEELNKWNTTHLLPNITFSTYVSLPKHKGHFDAIVYDEDQRLSERCLEAIKELHPTNSLYLSATFPMSLKRALEVIVGKLEVIKVDTKDAIDYGILPEPKIVLHKLKLSEVEGQFLYRKKAYGKETFVPCTAEKYYEPLSSSIEYWKGVYIKTNSEPTKNKWLSLCNHRLKWLSSLKTTIATQIRKPYLKYRTITFCSNTKQADTVCRGDVTSKKKTAVQTLAKFNTGEINHISAVNMLNEGVNLVDCQVGIFLYLSSSEIVSVQQIGRILRHKSPIIVYAYFEGIREEEILKDIISRYD